MYINPKIKIIGNYKKERFYCDICQFPLISLEDFDKNDNYDCCQECYLTFAESRKEAWKNGWRPKKAVVNSYISIRRKIRKQTNIQEK
jgi:hypothetical protein